MRLARVTGFFGIFTAGFALAILVLIRRVVRREWIAWVLLVLIFVGVGTWSIWLLQRYAVWSPLGPLFVGTLMSVSLAVVLNRHGFLGCFGFVVVVTALLNTPLTADVTRWYAWRTMVVAAMVIGLAVWGFRNVLGSQAAFATEEL